jgi:hypothetical protein
MIKLPRDKSGWLSTGRMTDFMNTLLGAMRGATSIHIVRIRRRRGMSAAIDSENGEVWSMPLSRQWSWSLAALDIMVGKSGPDYTTLP